MKKFAGTKPLDVIREQCKSDGISFNDALHKKLASDYIVIEGGGAHVFLNGFNGTFFGTTPDGINFNSSSTEHESCDWFQQLLKFFYVEKTQEVPQ